MVLITQDMPGFPANGLTAATKIAIPSTPVTQPTTSAAIG